MYVGETETLTFQLDPALGYDLNQAEEIEVKIANNKIAFKTYLKSASAPDSVSVDVSGLIVRANLQRNDSLNLKAGEIIVKLRIHMPASLYPEFPQGLHQIDQFVVPVLAAI